MCFDSAAFSGQPLKDFDLPAYGAYHIPILVDNAWRSHACFYRFSPLEGTSSGQGNGEEIVRLSCDECTMFVYRRTTRRKSCPSTQALLMMLAIT